MTITGSNADGRGRRSLARAAAAVVTVIALVLVLSVVAFRVGSAPTTDGSDGTGAGTGDPDHLRAQPVDIGFAADMIDHHDQAVQMALLAVSKTSEPAVRTLAIEIATTQRREGGRLDQFLRDRGVDRVDPRRTVMAWMGEPTTRDHMPGLASPQEMVALTNAEGADADRRFLELMIRHHEGGIHMAEFAVDHAETQDLRDLAARMIVDQKQQSTEMRQLLGEPG
jgi:uncharacterized protein (DUF305 family)